MPLEATMICLDNSEWMRNGDYTPTRMEAMHDAANLICGSKTQQNPENTVGVLALAGGGDLGGVRVLTSPTTDMGQLLSSCSEIRVGGTSNFAAGLRIAAAVCVGDRLHLQCCQACEEISLCTLTISSWNPLL